MYIILYLLSCAEDCFSLGGGYGDADISAIRFACESDGGKRCKGDFVEKKTAFCILEDIENIELDESVYTIDANIYYDDGHKGVVWSIGYWPHGNFLGVVHLYIDAIEGTAYARTPY